MERPKWERAESKARSSRSSAVQPLLFIHLALDRSQGKFSGGLSVTQGWIRCRFGLFSSSLETISTHLWVFYLRCSTGKLAVSTSQLPFGMTCGIAWYQDRFFPVSEAWSCWAKTRKHSEREPGPKKPTSLQSTDLTRLVSFEAKMLVTTSPLVRCTLLFHFLCCQGLSIFSDKQQPQAQTFSWQIHSNKEPSVTIEPWWKDFWKSWSWHYISLWRL